MTRSEPGPAVVITGAGSGIGRAALERFLRDGYGVVGLDRQFDACLANRAEHESLALISGDVCDSNVYESVIATAQDRFGGLTAAVFNAGMTAVPGGIDPMALDQLDNLLNVNVKGVALGMQAVIPQFRAHRHGSVVVTASVSGLAGDPLMWPYNASKAAVINMVRAWSLDYASEGIRVNAVCPGPIRTRMTDVLHSGAAAALGEAMIRNVPMGRWGEPEEVASAIAFLASAEASFITGATLVVDGGILAGTGQFPTSL